MKRLNSSQTERASKIVSNIGLLFFASTVLPIFINQIDMIYSYFGFIVSIIFWIFSILILNEVKND